MKNPNAKPFFYQCFALLSPIMEKKTGSCLLDPVIIVLRLSSNQSEVTGEDLVDFMDGHLEPVVG